MLPKINRLNTDFEFNVARKYGAKTVTEHFSVYGVKPTNYVGQAKVGIIVSNKVHKSAAHRNRLKRLVREYMQKALPLFPENLWIVVSVKSSFINQTYEEVGTELDKALQKILIPH